MSEKTHPFQSCPKINPIHLKAAYIHQFSAVIGIHYPLPDPFLP
jgi:hypothetical protein